MNITKLLNDYDRDGYVVLKNGMQKKECQKLLKQTIIPILHRKNIYLSKNKNKSGELIYGKYGTHIISKKNKHFRFSSFFNSKKLNTLLNKIHSRNINIKKWYFSALASEGLGWIHLRYPFYNYNNKEIDNTKYPDDSFHLDGTINNNELNPYQSVVLLPFITKVGKNEGGTAIIAGSHKLINDHILRYNYKTNKNLDLIIDRIVKNNLKKSWI